MTFFKYKYHLDHLIFQKFVEILEAYALLPPDICKVHNGDVLPMLCVYGSTRLSVCLSDVYQTFRFKNR